MKATPIYTKLHTTGELRKRVPLAPRADGIEATGFTTVPDGREDLTYSVLLDGYAVERLARKAAGNRSGRSKIGPLQVIITARRKVS